MYFRILHDERSGAVSYLLGDLDAGEAVLVDPRGVDVPLLSAMLDEHRLRLRWLLRTHEHDDVLQGEVAALEALGAPRVQHRLPMSDPTGRSAVLTFGNEHVQVFRTPGHTAGCLSYLWRDRLFCGGLLAVDTCPFQPRPALPEALWDSVMDDVFKRPDETLLFTSHAKHARACPTSSNNGAGTPGSVAPPVTSSWPGCARYRRPPAPSWDSRAPPESCTP